MGAIASQITSLTIVYSIVYSDADQRKHQSSASLAFVWGIHRGPVNFPHKWPVMRKMFPFDDVIMVTKTILQAVTSPFADASTWKWLHLFSYMMTSSNGNICVLLALYEESTLHRWIPRSDAELLCILWSAPEQTVEQTLETLVIWDAIALIMTSLWYDVSAWIDSEIHQTDVSPDSKVDGANMGAIWGRGDPGGPHVGPMNFAIWDCTHDGRNPGTPLTTEYGAFLRTAWKSNHIHCKMWGEITYPFPKLHRCNGAWPRCQTAQFDLVHADKHNENLFEIVIRTL